MANLEERASMHVFMFVLRHSLKPDVQMLVAPDFHLYAAHPCDCLLLTKAYMASGELSCLLCVSTQNDGHVGRVP